MTVSTYTEGPFRPRPARCKHYNSRDLGFQRKGRSGRKMSPSDRAYEDRTRNERPEMRPGPESGDPKIGGRRVPRAGWAAKGPGRREDAVVSLVAGERSCYNRGR